MRLTTSLLTAAALAAAWSTAADAAEIYRWVDADGVVHYSDEKPDDEPFATLQLDDTRPANYDPTEDPYSIINQARRLNETWIELATARQEREELRRDQAQPDPSPPPHAYDPYAYGPRVFSYSPPFVSHRGYPIQRPQRQIQALEELGLAAPRPHSINSSAHRERVERSEALPAVPLNNARHR